MNSPQKLKETLREISSRIDNALEYLNQIPEDCGFWGLLDGAADELCSIREEGLIKDALALPLRNCDVGTAEEQYNRFIYCCTSRKIPCRKSYTRGCTECFAKWLQMPYEQEGEE